MEGWGYRSEKGAETQRRVYSTDPPKLNKTEHLFEKREVLTHIRVQRVKSLEMRWIRRSLKSCLWCLFNEKRPARAEPTGIKTRGILSAVVPSLTLNYANQYSSHSSLWTAPFARSYSTTTTANTPPPPDSRAFSCWLRQSEGHVGFSSPPILLLLPPVMSSGYTTRSCGTDTWKYFIFVCACWKSPSPHIFLHQPCYLFTLTSGGGSTASSGCRFIIKYT